MTSSSDKPSRNEQEYFAKQDLEAIAALRRENDAARQAAPETRVLECPKCDGTLVEVEIGQVKVDRCNGCEGVWLDRGELEILAQHLHSLGNQNPVRRLLGDLFGLKNS